jgi:hypothetical protein
MCSAYTKNPRSHVGILRYRTLFLSRFCLANFEGNILQITRFCLFISLQLKINHLSGCYLVVYFVPKISPFPQETKKEVYEIPFPLFTKKTIHMYHMTTILIYHYAQPIYHVIS